ncbi:MAG: maleylpyruvate isomerase, partial [Pseudonocardiales bacterium]|nr:maleylpyruvate isomerase [Pseudonocardiales bacterium]
LAGTDPGAPSGLPDWTRAHLLAHLAHNADALINLLTWARTGVPTPMYASPDARAEAIRAGAGASMPELLDALHASAQRLADAIDSLPEPTWAATVTSAQGREITAADVPWLRVREVWIHAVDLDVGTGWDSLPAELASALLRELARTVGGKLPDGGAQLVATDSDVVVPLGPGGVVTVSGRVADLLAWLSGRGPASALSADGGVPTLPAWL